MVKLRVRNAGNADWPVLLNGLIVQFDSMFAPRKFAPLTVYLEARWTPLAETAKSGTGEELVQAVPLDRDVLAGETVVQSFPMPKLARSGRYRFDVRVVQNDGPEFTEPPSQMLHRVVDLGPK
jgi:hypothetical protein